MPTIIWLVQWRILRTLCLTTSTCCWVEALDRVIIIWFDLKHNSPWRLLFVQIFFVLVNRFSCVASEVLRLMLTYNAYAVRKAGAHIWRACNTHSRSFTRQPLNLVISKRIYLIIWNLWWFCIHFHHLLANLLCVQPVESIISTISTAMG